jgi:PhnB protein
LGASANFQKLFSPDVSISVVFDRRQDRERQRCANRRLLSTSFPCRAIYLENTMSNPQVKAIPEGMHTVTPHLTCTSAAEALDFYKRAFGAIELARLPGPGGKLMHAMMKIGDSNVMLMDEFPEFGALGPKSLKGSPVTMHLYVTDCDAQFARALEAGAAVKMPLADMFWGDRYGVLEDPYGHFWSVATHLRDLTPEEIQKAMAQMPS